MINTLMQGSRILLRIQGISWLVVSVCVYEVDFSLEIWFSCVYSYSIYY